MRPFGRSTGKSKISRTDWLRSRRSEDDRRFALNRQVQSLTNRLATLEALVQVSPAGISIQTPGNLVIVAGGRIQVTAGTNLDLRAGTNTSLTTGANLDITAGARASLSADAGLAIDVGGGTSVSTQRLRSPRRTRHSRCKPSTASRPDRQYALLQGA